MPNSDPSIRIAWALVFSTTMLAIGVIILVGITIYYAVQAAQQTDLTRQILQHEVNRWFTDNRPQLEVRFVSWGEGGSHPQLEVFNIGRGAATRVRFNQPYLAWIDATDQINSEITLGYAEHSLARARFYFLHPPVNTGNESPKKTLLDFSWATDFEIRYEGIPRPTLLDSPPDSNFLANYKGLPNDLSITDTWQFGVSASKVFLRKRVVSTVSPPPD